MSGRVRWQRDGETVVGYRKTDRRNVRRDPRDKLREMAAAGAGLDQFPIRLMFRLPKSLEGFIAPGPHGIGAQVLAGGYVRIGSHSGDQCFANARAFFAIVARDRPGFTTASIIVNAARPDQTYSRYLTVVSGCMVVSAGGLIEPKIYEAA